MNPESAGRYALVSMTLLCAAASAAPQAPHSSSHSHHAPCAVELGPADRAERMAVEAFLGAAPGLSGLPGIPAVGSQPHIGIQFQPLLSFYTCIPVKFHVLEDAAGDPVVDESLLPGFIQDLNRAFEGALQFYMDGPADLIDDKPQHLVVSSQAEVQTLWNVNNERDAVNVYFVQTMTFACGIGAIPDLPVDCGGTFDPEGIAIPADCFNLPGGRSILIHEMGHYFNLYHTHSTCFGQDCPGGFSCVTAGDRICDTPPDPGLSSSNVDAGCNYIGTELSPCDGMTSYDPDPTNYMSYAPRLCRDNFTPIQLSRARRALLVLRPELIQTCVSGAFNPWQQHGYLQWQLPLFRSL